MGVTHGRVGYGVLYFVKSKNDETILAVFMSIQIFVVLPGMAGRARFTLNIENLQEKSLIWKHINYFDDYTLIPFSMNNTVCFYTSVK